MPNTPPPATPSLAADFLFGIRASVAIAASVAAIGLAWGVLAGQAGLSPLETLLMSLLVFAGASQFVALDFWTPLAADLPVGALVVAVAIVNLRFVLLTATLRPLFAHAPRLKDLLLMGLVADENWALTMAEMRRRMTGPGFLLGSGLALYVSWAFASLAGRLIGEAVSDPSAFGLDFAFTAAFIGLALGLYRGRGDIVPWIVAGLAAILAQKVLGSTWSILLGALAGSLAGAVLTTLGARR